jgi:tRNA-specific 2-thiouridylase
VYALLAGVDQKKDQSYFLSRLNQHQLRHTLFPIGSMTKQQVRFLAKEYGLDTVAEKRSTRGICFIGKVDLQTFLSKYTISKPGDIVDIQGNIIGSHKGVSFYTIGQRKGLDIPATSPEAHPYYIVAKDAEHNRLIVAPADNAAHHQDQVFAQELHWVDGKIKAFPFSCQARIRYHQPLSNVTLSFENTDLHLTGKLRVKFAEPQRFVTPGQFIVFYDGEEVLGSAIID